MEIDLSEAIEKYFIEARMLLQDIEESVLALEIDHEDDESLNRLFRAAHTIKGSASVLGLEDIEKFTHLVESMMEKVRNHEAEMDPPLAHLVFQCRDHISVLVDLAEDEISPPPADVLAAGEKLLADLKERLHEQIETGPVESPPPENSPTDCSPALSNTCYHISLRPHPDLFQYGMDPLSFIAYLDKHGEVTRIHTVTDSLPPFAEFDAETCYVGFEISLQSDDSLEDIESVFEFLEDCCDLHILPPQASVESWCDLLQNLPEKGDALRQLFVDLEFLSATDFDAIFAEKIVADTVEDAPTDPIVKPAKTVAKKKSIKKSRQAILVGTDRLDDMVNMVGELVVATAAVNQHAADLNDVGLNETADLLSRLVENVRETTMRVRMVPIGETFSRFQRFIRDMCFDSGKKIDLIISGADTELDKTLIEKIGDPLMHLIRNSADHGIESPEKRLELGKEETGAIRLTASQEGGAVVITIVDDGKGIDRKAILAKGIEKGLIDPNNPPTGDAILDLIFEPGFSTAEVVTKLSGRGVGMDVVRKNIEELRGIIRLQSKEGEGTSFRILLPLSLAIIDGFMIGIGESKYIIPLDMVVECIPFNREKHNSSAKRRYTNLRGDILPYIVLSDFLQEDVPDVEYPSIIIVQYDEQQVGIVVDHLYGEMQAVIKPLGQIYKDVKFASGATILGDGSIALILDAGFIVSTVEHGKKADN